jgi:4-amino-4-deoxy-L-arabinose transferase-like glycosyltransferase
MKKLLQKKFLLLLGIILLAAFLRFYQLDTNPPSLTWDEVAWGYNAYSLGLDGKDEFGKFLPYQYLESFGDFKPPLYAYLDILPIKIFGLNEFATRFPSAFFGMLSVLITYFLTRKIFLTKKDKEIAMEIKNWKLDLPILTSFLLAISPWHIMLSRAAFEANIATFLLMSGVYCFLEGVGKKKYFLILSAIAFILSLYTFNSARVVAPLLVITLVLGTAKRLWQMKKMALLAGCVGILLLLPIVTFLFSPQAKLRFQEVNIFTDSAIVKTSNQEIANDHNAVWSKLIHNRRFLYSLEFLKHYFDNLSPNFLFITGDGNPKFSVQTIGQMYLWELPFLVIGIIYLFKKREGYWWLIPCWLLIAIIPAATARETPHALRIEGTLPTFQILVALGLVSAYSLIKKYKRTVFFFSTVLIVSITGCFVYYLHEYYTHYKTIYSAEWQYGYKEAITYAQQKSSKYDKIYLTGALGRPYMYTLFYTKYPPQQFREKAVITRDSFGFVHVKAYDKYVFGENDDTTEKSKFKQTKTLYIDTPKNIPDNAKKQKTFYLLDGTTVLIAYTL